MKTIPELKILFEEINKLKSKASMNKSQFCSQLTNSDEDEFLEFHFSLLEQKKRYFQQDLKMYFGFRQEKEKAHYFLKNKLKSITDEQLLEDVKNIMADIGFYTLDEYQQWISDLKNGTRNDKNEFVWKIMKSPFVEFHYSLLNDTALDDEFRKSLRSRFNEHKEKAEDLLLSKLDSNQDKDFHAEIIFMAGQIAKKHLPKILDYARNLAESQDDYTRDRAIIVLGWIGSIEDTDILKRHLLSDSYAKCRAWSASSYMQMWLRNKNEKLKQKAFEAYKTALSIEKDYFVLSVILASIQEIEETKLGVSRKALDDLDTEKIDLAKIKAIRYLDKY